MDNYASHMFTNAVQAEQAALGVRERFQKMYRNRFTESEIEAMLGPRLKELADENARLREMLAEKEPNE